MIVSVYVGVKRGQEGSKGSVTQAVEDVHSHQGQATIPAITVILVQALFRPSLKIG